MICNDLLATHILRQIWRKYYVIKKLKSREKNESFLSKSLTLFIKTDLWWEIFHEFRSPKTFACETSHTQLISQWIDLCLGVSQETRSSCLEKPQRNVGELLRYDGNWRSSRVCVTSLACSARVPIQWFTWTERARAFLRNYRHAVVIRLTSIL